MAVLVLGAWLLVPQQSAIADTYAGCYTDGSGCLPDSNHHTWCFGSTMDDSPNMKDASRYAMNNLRQQTRMTEEHVDCDPEFVDVVFQSRDLGGSRGEYECLDRSSVTPNLCFRGAVRYDGAQINQEGPQDYLQGNRDKTACHEVGHSVGLKHHDPAYNDCMVSGRVQAGHRTYNDHHRWHVNNR